MRQRECVCVCSPLLSKACLFPVLLFSSTLSPVRITECIRITVHQNCITFSLLLSQTKFSWRARDISYPFSHKVLVKMKRHAPYLPHSPRRLQRLEGQGRGGCSTRGEFPGSGRQCRHQGADQTPLGGRCWAAGSRTPCRYAGHRPAGHSRQGEWITCKECTKHEKVIIYQYLFTVVLINFTQHFVNPQWEIPAALPG